MYFVGVWNVFRRRDGLGLRGVRDMREKTTPRAQKRKSERKSISVNCLQ
jgi:hypothetical protein